MPKRGLRVGVAFGGRSVEHDVSIITGLQAVEVLSERHQPQPIYIARSGLWYAGEQLRDLASYRSDEPAGTEVALDIQRGVLMRAAPEGGSLLRGRRRAEPIDLDVIVLATHGTEGEDGCLQGLLQIAGVPYVGPSVGAAAAAMDKVMSKAVLSAASLPALPYLALRREQYGHDPSAAQDAITTRFELPVYVKPACLGSSVGVSRCADVAELPDALQLAFELDRQCLIEPAVEGGIEVNCAVLGRPGARPRASLCEQPLAAEHFLSFEDKYLSGGKAPEVKHGAASAGSGSKAPGMQAAKRLIPAPIDDAMTRRIQDLACEAFEAFGCAGVSRVDFLVDAAGNIYVNECNTIPGSFSFYLWEPAGLPFIDLMDELIDIAFAEHEQKRASTTVFATNLLAERHGAGKA